MQLGSISGRKNRMQSRPSALALYNARSWLEELDMMHFIHNRRFLLVAIVVTIGFASGADAQTSNEAVWQQFTDWLVSAPQFDGPGRCTINIVRD